MRNLLKAFFFKLTKDLTFKITLFIGLGLAIFLTLIYLAIDNMLVGVSDGGEGMVNFKMCTGQGLFYASLSPAQNFGLAIPINLVSFTVLEFTQGTIRNKIIAGNSKQKIYLTLLISGIVFSLILLTAYSLLCTGLGSIFGGFDINGYTGGLTGGISSPEYFWKMIVVTIIIYITISVFTIFFATLIRNIGPVIPIVIVTIIFLNLSSSLVSFMPGDDFEILRNAIKFINPLFAVSGGDPKDTLTFVGCIVSNVIYTAAFGVGGLLLFKHRDVK